MGMDFWLLVSVAVAFFLALLVFKLVSKTFKLVVFIIIFAVILGLVYFGYGSFKDSFKGYTEKASSPGFSQPSSSGCKSDSDCAFVSSAGDCSLVASSCNNLADLSHFYKPGTKVKCSIDTIVVDAGIACSCRAGSSGSSCQRL